MKILFITDNFPPESNAPSIRTYEHAKIWVRCGHRVTIITGFPNYPEGIIYPGYKNLWIRKVNIDGMSVIRVKTFMSANEGIFLRTIDYISFMIMSLYAGLLHRNVDVVIATSPQIFSAVSGFFISLIRGIPFVFELRDLWPSSIIAVGALKRSSLIITYLEKMELFLYKRSRLIIAVTEAFRENLIARGICSKKIAEVTNGVNLSDFVKSAKDIELARELRIEGRYVIGYIGTHGMAHALNVVLSAADLLRNDSRFAFMFVGSGAERDSLIARSNEIKLPNVYFVESQPRKNITSYWSLCDIALINLRNEPVFATVIPSKIYEAMAMGIPILAAIPAGIATQLVIDCGCGLTINPGNPIEMAEAIRKLAGDPDLCMRFSRSGVISSRRFDRCRLAVKMAKIIKRSLDV